MKKIAIFGAGGFGREVVELIGHINKQQQEWELVGFFDDNLSRNALVDGLPVLGGIAELDAWPEELHVVFAIGSPAVKAILAGKITNALIHYPVLVHPSVVLPGTTKFSLGKGTVICALCFISVNVEIGEHVLVNVCSTVGHDARIGNFTSIMPSVNVSGEVIIGEKVFIGVGAKIINGVSIEDNVTIGAVSAVIRDAPANTTLMGVPARVMINK